LPVIEHVSSSLCVGSKRGMLRTHVLPFMDCLLNRKCLIYGPNMNCRTYRLLKCSTVPRYVIISMASLCSMLLGLQMFSIKCQNVEMESVCDAKIIFHSELNFVALSTLVL
jgi:hypothetical protein